MKSIFQLLHPDTSDEDQLDRFQEILKFESGPSNAEYLRSLNNRIIVEGVNVADLLHGPCFGAEAFLDTYIGALQQNVTANMEGQLHRQWEKFQDHAASIDEALVSAPRSINICVPRVMVSDKEPPFLCNIVVLADPEDSERIARTHVKKSPGFTPILFQSLIATTDNEHWRQQRNHLNEVFLPKSSLAKIFPSSWARAKHCATRMEKLRREAGPHGVQVHEFFLHEAQAQLQLSLFGMDETFMDDTNHKIRQVFSGSCPVQSFGKNMCLEMMRKVREDPAFAAASDPEVQAGHKPVFGPLSKSVATAGTELGLNLKDQFGNMMLILFAGHDTTAHTMTWLAYELARHPPYQQRLQAEVDAMFQGLEGRDMVYEDCHKLPFLTRCTMETLRLWPAVANGTYRQLQFDDSVRGPGGQRVTLPKGTFVQVATWLRHRNPALWGDDVHEFNPDRRFREDEIWNGSSFAGYNPSSARFSPFTFSPRDCLGKNFAQMEIRTIVANLVHNFSFELSEPYANWDPTKDGPLENMQATMGPRDVTPEGQAENAQRQGKRSPSMAMYLKVSPRRPVVPAAKL